MTRVQPANHSPGLCLHLWQVFLMMQDDWIGSGRPELYEAASYGAPHEHLERGRTFLFYFTFNEPFWQYKRLFSSMPVEHTKIDLKEVGRQLQRQKMKTIAPLCHHQV